MLVSLLAWHDPQPLIVWKGAVIPLLMVIMFAMGLTLRWQDFRRIARKPKPLMLGVGLQFTVMPLLAWLLARVLALPPELALGILMVGACAGGTASNVMTYLANGDVALSVSMTLVSTLAGIVLTPALLLLLADTSIQIDAMAILFTTAKIVVLPLAAGLLISQYLPDLRRQLFPHLGKVATAAILAIIAIVVALNADELAVVGTTTVVAVMLHNLLGMSIGYGVARLSGMTAAECRTIAIEVGMQNSGLAAALALKYFTPMTALPGALFSIWHNISGSLYASYSHWYIQRAIRQQRQQAKQSGCHGHE